ncbi:MAG: DUF697 domain-containing protein [Thermoleophilia bacterium]
MAKLPVNVSKAGKVWREVSTLANRSAGILLGGDPGLVAEAQLRFAGDGGPALSTLPDWQGGLYRAITHSGDILVVFVRAEREAKVRSVIHAGRVQGRVVLAVDEGAQATGSVARLSTGVRRLSFRDTSLGWLRLLACCADLAGDDLIALGRRYPGLRPLAARRVVNHTAAQNALIGLLVILPGADMPAMTLNQIRMILSLGGLYGEKMDVDRAIEVVGVVAVGLGFRGVARRLIGLVPGFGWLFKSLIAYTSTSAMGSAAIQYFEHGSPVSISRLKALADRFKR